MDSNGDADQLEREATALAEAGHLQKAAQVFARATAHAPKRARLYEARAQCLLEIGDFSLARASAEQAVALEPDWAPGTATLGRALLNEGSLQDAALQLGAALRLATASRSELAEELKEEVDEVSKLLEKHWREHHDMLLPCVGAVLRIRQTMECRYCHLAGSEQGPGGAVWAAGAVLVKYITAHGPPLPNGERASTWNGARVLELGSGTGVAGLAAACAGAEVLLTDREQLLPLLDLNKGLNSDSVAAAAGRVDCGAFDWSAPPSEITCQNWDLVLAADLVYSFSAVAPFVTAISALLISGAGTPAASICLYAHNPRSVELDAEMSQALSSAGLELRKIDVPLELAPVGRIPLTALQRITLFVIQMRGPDSPAEPIAVS